MTLQRPRRGEIYWVDWEPHRGHEQAGRRPGLVISSDACNRIMSTCTVVSLTTQLKDSGLLVTIPADITGRVCQALVWQVLTIDRARLDGYIGRITPDLQEQVDTLLARLWGLQRDPAPAS